MLAWGGGGDRSLLLCRPRILRPVEIGELVGWDPSVSPCPNPAALILGAWPQPGAWSFCPQLGAEPWGSLGAWLE